MTEHATSVTTASPTDRRDADRQRLRAAGLVLLLGGLLFLAGVSRPVVTDWASAWDDPDTQLLLAQGAPGEFTLGFVLMGFGSAVMGIGAGLLLRAMRPLFTGRKAELAKIFAWVAIAGGLIVGGHRAVLAIVDYEAMAVDRSWISARGDLGTGAWLRQLRTHHLARPGLALAEPGVRRPRPGRDGDDPGRVHVRCTPLRPARHHPVSPWPHPKRAAKAVNNPRYLSPSASPRALQRRRPSAGRDRGSAPVA